MPFEKVETERPLSEWTTAEIEAEKSKLETEIASKTAKFEELKRKGDAKKESSFFLRRKWKKLEEDEKKHEEEKEELEKKKLDMLPKIQRQFAQMNPKLLAEIVPLKYVLKNPDFMRFMTGAQYIALMESERFSEEEKESATKNRFQFCWDWLESPEFDKYKKEKKEYETTFNEWVKKLGENPDEPQPEIVKKGEPDLPIKSPLGKAVYDRLKDEIVHIKEFAFVNQYHSEIFDQAEFVAFIKMGMIGKIRDNEAFTGRRDSIREKKVQDFLDIIENVEKKGVKKTESILYFQTFSHAQLEALRKRMEKPYEGKGDNEVKSLSGRVWKSPITLDLMDRTTVAPFKENDPADKIIILRHILAAWASGKISDDNKDAWKWLRGKKEGHSFFVIDNNVVEEMTREMGVKIPNEALVGDFEYKQS